MDKKIILIIEDEAPLRKALYDKLEFEGFSALEAKDGEEGLKVALENHPDLILLDIIMPKMDGFILLDKLRQDPWGKDAPVIILTNLNDSNYVLKSFRNDVYEYVVKTDIKIDNLVSKIKEKLL
jgi:DNA-binding response OmpR family regulator